MSKQQLGICSGVLGIKNFQFEANFILYIFCSNLEESELEFDFLIGIKEDQRIAQIRTTITNLRNDRQILFK